MKEMLTDKRIEVGFLVIILCSASFLFLLNLGNQYLWQDEAQTALISKTILTHGIPLGYDGKNFFSQELGAEYGKNYIWRWHTWFSFYLVAAFFKVFGVNTFSARLPFALFGMATVFLTYFFVKSLWKSKRTAGIATILLLLSVPFLILSRQCRYYSPAAFFSLWGLYSYLNILENKKYSSLTFLLSSLLLFHTHYLYWATLVMAVFTHALLYHRNKVHTVLLSSFIVLLLNLPWIIWLSSAKYGAIYSVNPVHRPLIKLFQAYILHIRKYVFSPLLLLIPIFIGGVNWVRNKTIFSKDIIMWKNLVLLLLFIIVNIMALTLFSPAPFFRYLAPLIPVFCVIIALILNSVMNLHSGIGVIMVAILLFFSPLPDYLYEISHDYDGPIEGIVKYLNQNGSKDDTVAITYGDLPLKFYTNMRVVGGLTGEDLSPAKEAEWIIMRKHVISEKDFKVREYLSQNVPRGNYRKIIIDYQDIPFENRESPALHKYRTVEDGDRVVIYRKRGDASP